MQITDILFIIKKNTHNARNNYIHNCDIDHATQNYGRPYCNKMPSGRCVCCCCTVAPLDLVFILFLW